MQDHWKSGIETRLALCSYQTHAIGPSLCTQSTEDTSLSQRKRNSLASELWHLLLLAPEVPSSVVGQDGVCYLEKCTQHVTSPQTRALCSMLHTAAHCRTVWPGGAVLKLHTPHHPPLPQSFVHHAMCSKLNGSAGLLHRWLSRVPTPQFSSCG